MDSSHGTTSRSPEPVTISTPTGNQWQVPSGIFINNSFHASVSGKTFDSINPATGEKLCTLALGGAADIEAAVKAARTAFKTTWGKKIDAYATITAAAQVC